MGKAILSHSLFTKVVVNHEGMLARVAKVFRH